uniref:C2H2-type domain-containing protein n=1 Tax=Caenorhabditis tropicalis TaxID=1561998 RepID=A0A1I7UG34_9PELO
MARSASSATNSHGSEDGNQNSRGESSSQAQEQVPSVPDTGKKLKANCAKCYDCHELIPHRLLYICHDEICYGYYQEKNLTYHTPFHFYENEKVFCSRCSFVGNHQNHQDMMKEAHPVATKLSSKNKDLEYSFRKLAYLDPEDLVDRMIIDHFKVKQLPLLPLANYLLNAEDSEEWEGRKKMLDDFKETVEKCRTVGADFARKQAIKAMNFYNEAVYLVNETIETDNAREKSKEREQRKRRDSHKSSKS